MNSRGAILVAGKQETGRQFLQFNLALCQDVAWNEAAHGNLKICPRQRPRKISKGRPAGYDARGVWCEAIEPLLVDANNAPCGFDRETKCDPMVRHIDSLNTKDHFTWVRNCAIFQITKNMGLSLPTEKKLPNARCAELKFRLINPRQYEFRIVSEHGKHFYLVDYLMQLRKIGPRLIWCISIPVGGDFCAAEGETWEQTTTRPENGRKIVFMQDGEITGHNDFTKAYGPLPAFGSEFALANAAHNAV
ncbi:hypothetical protein MMC18_003672 [Xylographa bjoerkii]|nr:hypothetical protein [Xylographa bjoerkii]